MVELRPYQREACSAVESEWAAGRRRTVCAMATGCHEPNQGILMADGSVKPAKDIAVGDLLMGPNGYPREVLALHAGEDEMFRITPIKGKPFTVNGDHVLSLVKTARGGGDSYPSYQGGSIECATVREWVESSKTFKHVHKLYRCRYISSFHGNDGLETTVDPYFVGVLLGDGQTSWGVINVTTPDEEIVSEVEKQAERYGMLVSTRPAGKATTYYLKSGSTGCKGGKLHNELKELGMIDKTAGNKSVPFYYKTLPDGMRLDVLAGLIDTDGSLTSGGYDFISKSRQLSEDVAFMARSVGLAAYVKKCKKTCGDFVGDYWRVSISGDCSIIPCRVFRKMAPIRRQKKDVLRTGFSVEPVGIGEYRGFTVDADNLYLLDDFTVTHNCGKTTVFGEMARRRLDGGVLVLAHRDELIRQAARRLSDMCGVEAEVEKADERYEGLSNLCIGSVQTMQGERLARFPHAGFSTVIVDEAHHSIARSYTSILQMFPYANVLGVTATPDRADRRGLAEVYDSIAYEYGIERAVSDGYLCPIRAKLVPLSVDITDVGVSHGDYKADDLGDALEPYLDQIARVMAQECSLRRTVVFLPLVSTAEKMADALNRAGLSAVCVSGYDQKDERDAKISSFTAGEVDVICNSMLLTEGWDCPEVDCIVVLRPTRSRSLYCLDEQTEVLTHGGWKRDVEIGEEVLAFDKDTGKTKFVPAIAKVRRPLEPDEFFCSIKGQSTDIRVTNHHRMIYDHKRRTGWKFKEAQDLAKLKDGAYLPVCGVANDFSGVPLTDAELTFIGWVMTDGCINKANNAITITQGAHQVEYCAEIEECIKACGFKFGKHIRKRTNEETHFNVGSDLVVWTISKGKPRGRDKHLTGWARLEPWLSKDLSPRLFDMSTRQFAVMLEAIYHGDGNKHWESTYHIGKGNKTFIERLQMMGIQRGYRASVSVEKANEVRKSDLWYLHIKKTEFVKVGSAHGKHSTWVKEEHTDEMCWCVENELGTLVTRRNGKVAIVGNCQMVGRGTRTADGKDHLLLLDFLWQTEQHDLCRPATLLGSEPAIMAKMEEGIERRGRDGGDYDLMECEDDAKREVAQERENALAARLEEMKRRKKKLVDPLQYAMSILDVDLADYQPAFSWERQEPTELQVKTLEKFQLDASCIETRGQASRLLDTCMQRIDAGLSTPKQIRFLEGRGYEHVGMWTKEQASKLIGRISSNGWKIPWDVRPGVYECTDVFRAAAS